MSLALEKVCDALSLKMVDDAATRLIAEKIVELAQRGVHDVATLTSMTLQEIRRAELTAAKVAGAVVPAALPEIVCPDGYLLRVPGNAVSGLRLDSMLA